MAGETKGGKRMYGKLKITATIHVLTGIHIGGSNAFSAIGAVNSPVIRDAKTQLPIIPGSTIKGKLRTLMARSRSNSYVLKKTDEDPVEVARLFGTVAKESAQPARLQFCDCFVQNMDELAEIGVTEVKFENTINRMSAIANPRQIERVIRGTIFGFTLIYDVYNEEELKEDFQNLSDGLKLLEMDYLGGHGTRGYGKIAFKNFFVTKIDDCIDSDEIEILDSILKEVEESELLPV